MNNIKTIMETPTQCPECGGEVKLIPAGVSKKTGKPYKAFYACKSPACKWTLNTEQKGGFQKAQGYSVTDEDFGKLMYLVESIAKHLNLTTEYNPDTNKYQTKDVVIDKSDLEKFEQQAPDASQEKDENGMFDNPQV
jgi:ssDNA-binding Zn-finger/Zn-ribbon topoisomerase 1